MMITQTNDKPIIEITPNGCVMYDEYGNILMRIGDFDGLKTSWKPMEKERNENMKNEIIKLYADRKAKSINEKYDNLIETEYNELEEVKRYNELINNFDASLAELVDEFNRETYKPFVRTGYTITSKYELDSYDIKKTISQKYENDRKKELRELDNELGEINAMLSLSTEQVYQTEILERYGVLKKGKLTI